MRAPDREKPWFFFGFLQNIAGYPNEHRTPPWPSRVIVYGSLTEHRATYTAQNENEEGSATGVRLEEATSPGVEQIVKQIDVNGYSRINDWLVLYSELRYTCSVIGVLLTGNADKYRRLFGASRDVSDPCLYQPIGTTEGRFAEVSEICRYIRFCVTSDTDTLSPASRMTDGDIIARTRHYLSRLKSATSWHGIADTVKASVKN